MRCEWTELDVLSSFLAEKANVDALSAGLATHVVSAILWGRDAVVTFEREAHETALSEVQASLLHDVEIARSRLTNSTAGHAQPVNVAGVHIFADTAGSDDISVTTLEASLQYLQNLPSCGEGQMVPVASVAKLRKRRSTTQRSALPSRHSRISTLPQRRWAICW